MTIDLHVSDAPAAAVAQSLAAHRPQRVCLTGGTVAIEAYRRLSWAEADFWWGDERFVPRGHADRNDQQAREAFLDRLGVPDGRVHAMPAADEGLTLEEAADAYAGVLPEHFDVVLLGIGPDGHVASLFPGHDQVHEQQRLVVAVTGSPKPPPERLSLTRPSLSASEEVWFIASGASKAAAVARALAEAGSLEQTPARGVAGRSRTRWFLDPEAAADL